ncbi:MAG: response regulator transcription factor [Dehalococcoidia bacterium]|nr:response regulator transcription factor [Dehalococcoidia bacterium]
MRILVVEDESNIALFVKRGLIEAGYSVDLAQDGNSGLEFAISYTYDVIVLDIMLPGKDGISIVRELRSRGIKTPVIFLTARDTVEDRVLGLEMGADDYLIKPFAFSELLARIRTLLRRPPLQAQAVLTIEALELDTIRHEVRYAGRRIELSAREFALLEYMMRHINQAVSRTQIAEHVWNIDFNTDSNVVDVYVGYLRRKLDRAGAPPIIRTVRGIGYRLVSTEAEDE